MNKDEIREIRKARGLTQESFAQMALVDVTTVQRWEAGLTEPSLPTLKRLKDLFNKHVGLHHPFFEIFMSLGSAAAILDEYGVYRKANRKFLDAVNAGDSAEVVGVYCTDVSSIWERDVIQLTGLEPEKLLFGEFDSINIREKRTGSRSPGVYEHEITAIRQTYFSGVLLHQILEINLPQG